MIFKLLFFVYVEMVLRVDLNSIIRWMYGWEEARLFSVYNKNLRARVPVWCFFQVHFLWADEMVFDAKQSCIVICKLRTKATSALVIYCCCCFAVTPDVTNYNFWFPFLGVIYLFWLRLTLDFDRLCGTSTVVLVSIQSQYVLSISDAASLIDWSIT